MQTEMPFWKDEGMRELAGELMDEDPAVKETYN
jgi:hypothetical protein